MTVALDNLLNFQTETQARARPRSSQHAFHRADHVEYSRALVADLGGPADVVADELHAWRYAAAAGLWMRVDRSHASRLVQNYAGEPIGDGSKVVKISASDVAGSVRLALDRIARPGFFSSAPRGIVFANGFLQVTPKDGAVLVPHDRAHRARAGYAFAYEHGALPRRFLAFLDGVFRDDVDRNEKARFVQEFFGACVLGDATTYQRSTVGVGDGDNGKTRLADMMLECMPAGTTSAVPPQELGNEYRRAMLVGKHLNAVGELPERDILASESFKAIVSGDPIVARIIRESPLMYRPIAGHYFASNKLPGTPDQTEGFWRRFVVLSFNRSFKDDPTKDPHIATTIIAEERAAIVSWLVGGAVRLMRQREYTIPSSHHAALAAWRKNADQVALFVEAETRPLHGDEIVMGGKYAAGLYSAYRRWCEGNGHRAMASNNFGSRMKGLGLASVKTNTGWRYPVEILTAAQRAAVTGSDTPVTDCSSPQTREVARA